jgi:gamma-glutamylaminecyclotransferase
VTKIFTYGTLLSGEPNHRVLRGSHCLGPALTPPRFTLVDLGAFPGMLAQGAHAVEGELYDVDDDVLAALDRLEGHPSFYTRASIVLAGWRRAETYFFPAARAAGRPVIDSGSWRRWVKDKTERRCGY